MNRFPRSIRRYVRSADASEHELPTAKNDALDGVDSVEDAARIATRSVVVADGRSPGRGRPMSC